MPVYNHEAFLPLAIASVRAQEESHWELIIIDDGSRDASGRIADEAAAGDRRIRVIHQTNAGPAVARNRGLSASRAPWIAFLDSDDTWYPGTLAHYLTYTKHNPEARFLFGYWDKYKSGQIQTRPPRHQEKIAGFADLFEHVMFGSSCVCFQRSLLEAAGLFNPELPPVEDYDLFLRMALRTALHPIGHATGARRRHGANISANTGANRLKEAQLLERYSRIEEAKSRLSPDLISRRLGRSFYSAGREYFKAREYAQAAQALTTAQQYHATAKVAALRAICRGLAAING